MTRKSKHFSAQRGRGPPLHRRRWSRPTKRQPLCPRSVLHAAHSSRAFFVWVSGTSVPALKRRPRSLYSRDACSNCGEAVQSTVFYVILTAHRACAIDPGENEPSESPALFALFH